MRRQDQLSLSRPPIEHPHAAELEKISAILSSNPRMAELVAQDLVRGVKHPGTGARGLTGDQVLRIVLIKQMNGFSYEELAFHLADSVSYRSFCGFGALEPTPGRSTLAENIKKISARTLEKINHRIVRYAIEQGVEKGRRVRIDATVTETNIHAPTDSTLLWDGVRVLTRLLAEAQRTCGFNQWSNHSKRAKRRVLAIQHTGNAEERLQAYVDLLRVAHWCAGYASAAISALSTTRGHRRAGALAVAAEMDEILTWFWCAIDQTERRVLKSESVPSEQTVVSIFEPHTDIIIKDRRETLYGHKLFLAAGESGLITDCVVAQGNPADSSMTVPMLRRQRRILGRTPEQAALDGAFASRDNLVQGQALGITDLAFSKKRGLEISEMTRSTWIYRCLRNFRAGIEGLISFLKRALGLDRCTWKGAASFASYVMTSVIAGNLLTLARYQLA
ncbi:MAG: ISNCY family transposase [Gemmatimonadota bacterium]